VGFNPDLTAYDNVVINGVMMGLSPREARARFDDVIAFAELEDFLDLKLKNYSSGMQVRLAFSLMVQSDADMLLIDEVLAVGDAAFQQKCLDVFYRLRDEGRTIVLVTHDMPMIERFCRRALLLEEGRVALVGEPHAVSRRYLELNFDGSRSIGAPFASREGGATIADVWIEDERGRRVGAIPHGEQLRIRAQIDVHERIERPAVHVALTTEDALHVFGATTKGVESASAPLEPGERLELCVSIENPLRSGRYFIDCSVHGAGRGTVSYRGRASDFVVFGGAEGAGLVTLEHSVELQRGLVEARP
jgi:ABC-type multidrug transport system ATPase subunit